MRPRKARIATFNPKDPALFQQVFRDTDPGWSHLLPTQEAVESCMVPLWYPDLKDGLRLKPIQIDCAETVDAQDTWLGEMRNTLQFKLGRNGTQSYQVGAQWLRMRLARYCGAPVFAPDTTTRVTGSRLTQGYTALGLTVEQDIGPGTVKETITIDAPPVEYVNGKLVLQWSYQTQGLTPAMDGERVAWSTKRAAHLYSEALNVWDANGAKVPAVYQLVPQWHSLGIAIAEADLASVTWPLTIDPTTITVQADALANRSTLEENYDSFEDGFLYAFMRITLPSISGGTVDSAVLRLETFDVGTGGVEFSVNADNTGVAWTDASSHITLEAMSFNGTTATAQTAPAQFTSYDYDIKGDGTKGIVKAYADAETDITCRLTWTNEDNGAVSTTTAITAVRVGNKNTYSGGFYNRSNATLFPRIAVTYTPASLPPTTEFSADDTTPDEGQNVTFTDLSNDNGSAITDWAWTFGDTGTSTQMNPVHKYSTPGTYTVSLTTTNAYGSDTETKVSYIVVADVPESSTPLTGNVTLAKVRYSTNDGSSFTAVGAVTQPTPPEGSTDAIEMTHTDITDNHRLYDYGWTDAGEMSCIANYTEARFVALRALSETRVLWSIQWNDPEHTVVDPEQRFYGHISGQPTIATETEDRWTISFTVKATGKADFFQGS